VRFRLNRKQARAVGTEIVLVARNTDAGGGSQSRAVARRRG
jgi:hypothetical protein